MTNAETYEFDLNGVIVYRDVIPPDLNGVGDWRDWLRVGYDDCTPRTRGYAARRSSSSTRAGLGAN